MSSSVESRLHLNDSLALPSAQRQAQDPSLSLAFGHKDSSQCRSSCSVRNQKRFQHLIYSFGMAADLFYF